jgi:hypothetical protein
MVGSLRSLDGGSCVVSFGSQVVDRKSPIVSRVAVGAAGSELSPPSPLAPDHRGATQGRPEGGHPGERGRQEMAPIVDTSAHLPTLSVPGSGSGTSPLQ